MANSAWRRCSSPLGRGVLFSGAYEHVAGNLLRAEQLHFATRAAFEARVPRGWSRAQ